MVKCGSCSREFKIRDAKVGKSYSEGITGFRPTRAWCPHCGECLRDIDPEAVEVLQPATILTFIAVMALLGGLFVLPDRYFGIAGLAVLTIGSSVLAVLGNLRYKIVGLLLVVICIYVYSTGQYIT